MCPPGTFLVSSPADSEEEDEEEDNEEDAPGDAGVVVSNDRAEGSSSATPYFGLPVDSQLVGHSDEAVAVPPPPSV